MQVLASFKAEPLLRGLSRYENRGMVKVIITVIFQWLLDKTHDRKTPEWVLENIQTAISETYHMAEYLLKNIVVIDAQTGVVTQTPDVLVYTETAEQKYPLDKNYMWRDDWYHRYCELVEYLLTHYARTVMGFYVVLQNDKHAVNVQCVEFTNYYICVVIQCWNLIEYQVKDTGNVP